MSNRRNNQFTWNPHNKATVLDCNFIVSSTDSAGYGITSLNKSGRIQNVFMNTSATKATGSPGGSTGPAAGLIYVTLQDNYNTYLGSQASIAAPKSGSSITISSGTPLTAGNVYTITALGSTTTAQWHTVGVAAQITPAVGVSFIAAATSGTGTGTVEAPATSASGITHVELIGNPNVMNCSSANVMGSGGGMTLIFGCYKVGGTVSAPTLTMNPYTPAGTNNGASPPIFTGTQATLTGTISAPTLTGANSLAAPAAGTLISLVFYMNDSAQGV